MTLIREKRDKPTKFLLYSSLVEFEKAMRRLIELAPDVHGNDAFSVSIKYNRDSITNDDKPIISKEIFDNMESIKEMMQNKFLGDDIIAILYFIAHRYL